MRRWFVSLAALGLFGMALGCGHTAGVCDCDIDGSGCCNSCAGGYGPGPVQGVPVDGGDHIVPSPMPRGVVK